MAVGPERARGSHGRCSTDKAALARPLHCGPAEESDEISVDLVFGRVRSDGAAVGGGRGRVRITAAAGRNVLGGDSDTAVGFGMQQDSRSTALVVFLVIAKKALPE